MELIRLDEFRLYYNTHIFPELQRTERLRRRLLVLLSLSLLVGLGVFVFTIYLGVALVTLFLLLPVTFYAFYLGYRIQRFQQRFKPRIVGLILDFMNERLPNFTDLEYDSQGKIAKQRFQQSLLFKTSASYYEGEDYITGRIGEMPFEMSELVVREPAPLTNKLQDVFEGVFLYAIFPEEDTEGSVIIWPRRRKQYLIRAIKEYNWEKGATNQDHEIMNDQFREHFLVYGTEDTHIAGILSEPMQAALVEYLRLTGKDIYISFQNRHIFAAVTEERDLLEPSVLSTNASFELIREFFRDLMLVLRVVEDFDQTH